MKNPKEIIRVFGKELENIGINDFSYSDSTTDFGNSSYLLVGPFKVRCSDHGVTSVNRIINEMHLDSITWVSHLEEIERYYYPERFEEVITLRFGDIFEFPKDKLYKETYEYKIINDNYYETKRGRIMVLMQRKNKKSVKYVRV